MASSHACYGRFSGQSGHRVRGMSGTGRLAVRYPRKRSTKNRLKVVRG